ncbi:MAG: hypothetical protein L0210_07575 [Rhodospirillales bacterium]|nr:hypothetical protein [Rhodospirillales bacterium]
MTRATFLTIALATTLSLAPGQPASAEEVDSKRAEQVLGCEEAARLSIDRDRLIDQSITGAQEPDPFGGGGSQGSVGSSFSTELSRYEEEQRRRRLIDDCLAQGGFEPESE